MDSHGARPGSYQHEPLPHSGNIRQIHMQPSQDHDAPVRCSFTYATLKVVDENILYDYTTIRLFRTSGEMRQTLSQSLSMKGSYKYPQQIPSPS